MPNSLPVLYRVQPNLEGLFVKKTFGMTADVDGVRTELTVTVEDVWYAARHPDSKELVMLGVWLPPNSDGLLIEKVADQDLPELFSELLARTGT